jgi:hypothetical protein
MHITIKCAVWYIAFGDELKVTKIFRSTEADRLFLKIRPQFHRRYDQLLYLAFFEVWTTFDL